MWGNDDDMKLIMAWRSLIAKFSEELLLIKEAILIEICLFDELQNVIIADIDVKVLVEDCLDLVDAH